ncbi:MAG: hypothetical protein ACTJHV_03095 [Cellulosimicrobium funkei]
MSTSGDRHAGPVCGYPHVPPLGSLAELDGQWIPTRPYVWTGDQWQPLG